MKETKDFMIFPLVSSRASLKEASVFPGNDFYTVWNRRSGGHSQEIFSKTDFQKWRYVILKIVRTSTPKSIEKYDQSIP